MIDTIIVPRATVEAFNEAVERAQGDSDVTEAEGLELAKAQAVIAHAYSVLDEELHDNGVLTAPDDRQACALLSAIAEVAEMSGRTVPLPAGGREAVFDEHDPHWWPVVVKLLLAKINVGQFDFLPGPTHPTPIPEDAIVAVLGDWGTNLYGAPFCASAIERGEPPDVIIHLGDVYYTGSRSEVTRRFVQPWPSVPGAISRACNANHEMLSGGKPYAEIMLPFLGQSSSLFWLENSRWVLVGLDTAYDEWELGDLQRAWLSGIALRAKADDKRLILFSHHQLWQTQKPKVMNLHKSVDNLLRDKLVHAWYWGHEHLCGLFETEPSTGMTAACIGHSGYPYWRIQPSDLIHSIANEDGSSWYTQEAGDGVPKALVLDGPNDYIEGHKEKYGPNGYAVLELGGALTERIHNAAGEVLHTREIPR